MATNRTHAKLPDLLSLMLMNLIWAGTYPATALALGSLSASFLTVLRLFAGTLLLSPFLFRGAQRWTGRNMVRTGFLGIIGFSLPLFLQTEGLHHSTAAMAAISIALEPLVTALVAALFLKETLPAARRWALAMAGIGAWSVSGFPRPGSAAYALGDGLLIAAIFCFAVYNVYSARLTLHLTPQQATAGTFAGGFVGALPLWLLSGTLWPRVWHASAVWAALYLGVLGTALAYLLWMSTASRVPVSMMALFLYLQPIMGVVLSMWIAPASLHWSFYLGSALVLAALYVGRTRRGGKVQTG